jgi:hypothetical protein
MAGVYTGVQTRIRFKEIKTSYADCSSHIVNMVLNDTVTAIPQVMDYFCTPESACNLYNGNNKPMRSSLYHLIISLKRLCTTRWP